MLVTLQVVEHLWDLRGFLRDCAPVLRPGGLLVVTTPNRPVFSPGLGRGEKPTNPFHVEELDAEQLHDLLVAAGFVDVAVRGLHHGDRIAEWEDRQPGVGPSSPRQVAARAPARDPHDRGCAELRSRPVTAADFVVGTPDGAQDLVATLACAP